ncbi:polysaccharide deacetylase family protein [Confluentibacter flavum]|uniref:Polysaccharide deacetylase family protein n=1 Tax=Confluentibacter flavum TaxID=1909700 RepID=A0A2N3HHE7_9FLAO|nr:polysaccharide deacetylase family protein [Confluentibacter flavum]PKQ44343.1 polysaccharide deacetylase family protein [Confluentibacter flavum]
MTLTPIKTPLVAKKMFPNYVWDIPTDDKIVYLTFDDGPTPEITNWVLNTLKSFHAKATFFCIGKNIENYPDIFQDILNEGHTVGNHTYNHVKGWKTKAKDYLLDIEKTQGILNSQMMDLSSSNVNLFRPPYGQITPKQGKELMKLGYKIIMWDVISFDWDKTISMETCLNNVTTKSTNGSIIVFHDSVKASKNMQYTLPKVLKYFSEKGYSFKPLIF